MRYLQITLLILGLLFQSTQTFRLVYTKWLQPKDSVLDKYNEKVEQDIEKSKNIEELMALYGEVYQKVKEYEKNPDNKEIEYKDRQDKEPYKTEGKVRRAITDLESHGFQIHKLRFFWFCGLISIIIGFIVYVKIDRWLGIIGFITGFTEMIYWTCPVIFGVFGPRFEFERLINNKLFFSVITWLLLIISWFILNRFEGKSNGPFNNANSVDAKSRAAD